MQQPASSSEDARALGHEISAQWREEAMQPSHHATNERIRLLLQRCIETEWPGQNLTLTAFGSSVTGLGTRSSDLDLVLLDPSRPDGRWTTSAKCKEQSDVAHSYYDAGQWLPEWYNVTTLAFVFRSESRVQSIEAIHAIVPIVKLHIECDGQLREVDISVNNLFSVRNTRLLATYVKLQPDLLPPLYFGIRKWFKARGLNDSSGKQTGMRTMSSYAIVLLVLKLLQEKKRLPILQHRNLLDHLKPIQRITLSDGYDGNRSAGSAPPIKTWDCSFVDPLNEHMQDFRLIASRGWRAVFSAGSWEGRFPSFQMWDHSWETLREMPEWSHLPNPRAMGIHKKSPADEDEVGSLFFEFIPWIKDSLTFRDVIDVSRFGFRPVNDEIDPYGYSSSVVDPTQPSHWAGRGLVIADPFIKQRNVIQGMNRPAMRKLNQEVDRALMMLSYHQRHARPVTLARLAS